MVATQTVILGGGALAAAALLWKQEGGSAILTPAPTSQKLMSANMSGPIWTKLGAASATLTIAPKAAVRTAKWTGAFAISPLVGAAVSRPQSDSQIRQQLNALESQAKSEYNKLTKAAKEAAIAELNSWSPSPGLTGEETWEEASKKVGAVIGSTVAVAACNAIPVPAVGTVLAATVCATLGAMIGSFLGGKLGPWAKKVYADVREWVSKTWGDVKDSLSDAGDAVSDTVKEAGKRIVGWIT